jgi:DNA polymerase III subunit chi
VTEVNFYTGVPDRQVYACRLLRKTLAAGLKTGVWGPMRLLERLDQALWTFEPGEFLPHLLLRSDSPAPLRERTPVLLSDRLDDLVGCQALLNFEPEPPPGLERFERVLELVSTDPEQVAAGRNRFKAYKQLGVTLNHHVIGS